MPKQTFALICGITIILFVIALKTSKPVPPPMNSQTQIGAEGNSNASGQVANAIPVNSILNLSPKPISVLPGQKGSVDVNINTSGNEVTAIQLEIAYDPNMISNVQVSAGGLFANPVVLIDKNTVKEGRYTYAYGITPNHSPILGNGTVATISFTALDKPGKSSQLALLPSTLVTARGISTSVLKLAEGTLVQISQP
jgi:hypothetical protein